MFLAFFNETRKSVFGSKFATKHNRFIFRRRLSKPKLSHFEFLEKKNLIHRRISSSQLLSNVLKLHQSCGLVLACLVLIKRYWVQCNHGRDILRWIQSRQKSGQDGMRSGPDAFFTSRAGIFRGQDEKKIGPQLFRLKIGGYQDFSLTFFTLGSQNLWDFPPKVEENWGESQKLGISQCSSTLASKSGKVKILLNFPRLYLMSFSNWDGLSSPIFTVIGNRGAFKIRILISRYRGAQSQSISPMLGSMVAVTNVAPSLSEPNQIIFH